jgi:hypothetical protein
MALPSSVKDGQHSTATDTSTRWDNLILGMEKFAYLCTSSCCRVWNTLLVNYALREMMVPLPETVLKIAFWNTSQ